MASSTMSTVAHGPDAGMRSAMKIPSGTSISSTRAEKLKLRASAHQNSDDDSTLRYHCGPTHTKLLPAKVS